MLLLALVAATTCLAGGRGGDDPAAAPGDRWPGFRGIGTGWTAATNLPTTWTSPAWSTELAGDGQSSPVVIGGRVFVTSIEGADKERAHVACLALADGALLWSRSLEASSRREATEMVARGAPTPAVDDERVYAFFESGDFVCLDHEGEELWRRDLHSDLGPFLGKHGVASSPVLAGDVVLLLLDHEGPSHLVALDVATGEDRWVVEREPRVSWSTPVLAGSSAGDELVVSSSGVVEGYAVADGALRWRVDRIEGNTVPSPTVIGDEVVVACSKGDGVTLVRRPIGDDPAAAVAWVGRSLAPSGFGSPLVCGDAILLMNRAGVLSTVALATGASRHDRRLACGGIWASPIASGDRVWFFGQDGVTSVVQATDAGLEEIATNELEVDGGVYGVAAIDGAFVVRERSRVVCLR